ncbi:MAG: tRNA pseudouridine(38-40) synthase TruA [Methanocellales archaeon]|nr:tRNA pseudouridine(38-40) synthase TruA [Methanocellales archaeon]MDD3292354.1 tRNA pseudouridine(38-40) synthase TruA [Methanocellales archaeon]MDD5235612.1 tRNA pseudouridine(38-40) synthase TruA [Methanocellales archaeon]MDD5485741.1 tRNA pseudouridine(38-40) synthase TruA [Methanocellales archaeon]
MTSRIALKLAYLGNNYHGFQIQPEVPTIEEKLFKALKTMRILDDPQDSNYSYAGRTDKGVHALEQVVAFNTNAPDRAIPRAITNELPADIWAWSRAEVPKTFDPRRDAISREYRYVLYGKGLDISRMRDTSKLLIGVHDFANFATNAKEDERDTKRRIERVEIRIDGSFMTLDITADGFMWNMVRKIVTGLSMVGDGSKDYDWFKDMLRPDQHEEGIAPAPPFGLVLKRVDYLNITFIDDEYVKRRAGSALQNLFLWHGTMGEVLQDMRDAMGY